MKLVEIKHTYNDAYSREDYGGDDYMYSELSVTLDGKKVFYQGASENLSECPEDARFCRDLNDPADVIDLIEKLLGGNQDYKVVVTKVLED